MADRGLTKAAEYAVTSSSILLRLFSYVFLRWVSSAYEMIVSTALTKHTDSWTCKYRTYMIDRGSGAYETQNFPEIIWSLFAIYVPSFLYTLARTEPYTVVKDEVHVITHEPPSPREDAQDVDPRYVNGGPPKDPGEELEAEETVVLELKDAQPWSTALTGRPSPSSLVWSAVPFLINLALVAMVWDLVYRAPLFYPSHELSMARAGYVSDTTAKILVREPDTSRWPVFLSYRYADSPVGPDGIGHDTAWKSSGRIDSLDESTDYTGLFSIHNLKPDTRYQYTAANHTGYFTTAPSSGQLPSRPHTDPSYTFLHSSCLKNHLPYNPLNHPLSNRGLAYLASAIPKFKASFMLFLGDFIYIDVPKRLGASSPEDYRREYRQIYSSPDWEGANKELPWIHVYDDHEIANDWDKNTTGFFPAANDPYQHYHIAANPPPHREGETYFSFTSGPAAFFMLDTRRYRSPNDGSDGWDPSTKTLLGQRQLADLLAWLAAPEPTGVRWKVVVSSVPFTKNWWMNAQDTWRGYLGERQLILEAMWDLGASGAGVGVIVLSGDRHEFAATAFPPPPGGKDEIIGLGHGGAGAQGLGLHDRDSTAGDSAQASLKTRKKIWPQSATVHEFSASPLNMFYLPLRTYSESSTSAEYTSDVCVKYIPDGNSKFGAVSISSPGTSDQSLLHYRLFVDGEEKWSYTLTSPVVGRAGMADRSDAIWG